MTNNQALYKYKKYKTKYLNLKNKLKHDQHYDFYFVHSTATFENLLNILKTGVLSPGKDLEPEQRKLCGEDATNFVFTNIYFEDVKNLTHAIDFSLLFHPKIMYQNGFYFNKGWEAGLCDKTIYVDGVDKTITKQKINQIKEFLKNPIDVPEIIRETGFMNHEVLFDHPISLKHGNLIGIVCNYCDATEWSFWKKTTKKLSKPTNKPLLLIQKTIADKPYSNVKIMTRNVPFYTLNELTQ